MASPRPSRSRDPFTEKTASSGSGGLYRISERRSHSSSDPMQPVRAQPSKLFRQACRADRKGAARPRLRMSKAESLRGRIDQSERWMFFSFGMVNPQEVLKGGREAETLAPHEGSGNARVEQVSDVEAPVAVEASDVVVAGMQHGLDRRNSPGPPQADSCPQWRSGRSGMTRPAAQ